MSDQNAGVTTHPNAPLRLAINGFGRIGRNVLRALIERFDVLGEAIELVAVNDVADAAVLLHLLRFDSTHGRLSALGVHAHIEDSVPDQHDQHWLVLTKNARSYRLRVLQQHDPAQLPWQTLRIDVVLECSGHFRSYEAASQHRHVGAKQVIVGAAPFDEVDASIVMGVNDDLLTRQLPVISSVSCTTQALVPLIATLNDAFGVVSVMMTEIHAVTADQNVLDQSHRDWRRARASGHNIIPTTSSSIAATERVLPHMQGRLAGHSIRVPTIDVAAIDVTLTLIQSPSVNKINQTLQSVSEQRLATIMGYCDQPLVSSDFLHQPQSLIIDALQTMQVGALYKVFAWYDNEWGYANRLLDLCLRLSQLPPT